MNPIDTHAALFALIRAVHFGACLLLPGIFIFDRFIVDRNDPAYRYVDTKWAPISRYLILLALPAALISGAAWLGFVAMDLNEVSFSQAIHPDVLRIVLDQTQFGTLWKFRALAWIATALAAISAVVLRRTSSIQTASTWIALLCSAVLAVSIARAGHGADGTRWHQAADAMHLCIGAAWPIGLLPLGLLLWRFRREGGLGKWLVLFPIVQRFSVMSFSSVALLTASGIGNSWSLVGTLSNLVSTPYGRTLLVKISLFVLMGMFGAINMLYLRPRLAIDFKASTEATRQTTLSRLQINVWLEILLGVGVLLAAGLLGTLMPACDRCCCAVAP